MADQQKISLVTLGMGWCWVPGSSFSPIYPRQGVGEARNLKTSKGTDFKSLFALSSQRTRKGADLYRKLRQ